MTINSHPDHFEWQGFGFHVLPYNTCQISVVVVDLLFIVAPFKGVLCKLLFFC